MTSQEKKNYLMQYQFADRHINELIEEKERVRAMLERITPTYSESVGGKKDDKMVNGVARLLDLENKINSEIDALYSMRLNINADLSQLHDNRMYRVLYLRYIADYKWERIAYEMGYDLRYIYKLHGQALFNLKLSQVDTK